MSEKRVLIINLGWEQEPLINLLNSKGYILYGVHYNKEYYNGVNYKDVLICDLRDLDKILEYAKSIMPDAVISDECDYSHFAQALVCQSLNINGPTIEQALISSNKFIQRQKAKEAGVLVPIFALIQSLDDIRLFVQKVGFPIILKPIDNRGSFGVSKVESEDALFDAYLEAVINSHSRLVIAEQFIDGYEITVDGYCFNKIPKSLSLAKKNKGDAKIQVSLDIKYPGELPDSLYEKAMKNNQFVNVALGYNFGMTHSEYMIDAYENIYLIESANRGGGVYTSEIIVPAVSGIDILETYANDVFTLNTLPMPDKIEKNNVILKFFSFKTGVIKKIEGIEELLADSRVMKFKLAIKEGDIIKPISTDGNRHGFIIVKSNDDIRNDTEHLMQKINIVYE